MLQTLQVEGLALVDSLSIDFGDGFNVITGETGAGKSVLIRALSLLFGGKASSESVRHGCERAIVSGHFFIPRQHLIVEQLLEYNLVDRVDQQSTEVSLLLRRIVSDKGRSQAYINDIAVSLGVLKQIGQHLIDIYAQNEAGRLLDPRSHLDYLDKFLSEAESKNETNRLYKSATKLISNLQKLLAEFATNCREQDYIEFRIKELRKFNPQLEDFESLQMRFEKFKSAEHTKMLFKQAEELLDQQSEKSSTSAHLWRIAKIAEQFSIEMKTNSKAQELKEIAHSVAQNYDDLNYQLTKFSSQFNQSEDDQEEVEARLSAYRTLFRKFNVSGIQDLLEQQKSLEEQLSFIATATDQAAGLLIDLAETVKKLKISARQLSKTRRDAALIIKERLERELAELAMSGANLSVEFSEVESPKHSLNLAALSPDLNQKWLSLEEELSHLCSDGYEQAQFLLCSNPGEPALPLHKIASGGEMSRIMLALKKALSVGANSCVLVFDEIDAGISGRVANIVGKKLRQLSSEFQVICISHLPQVAAYGSRHFYVSKSTSEGRTQTSIKLLNNKEREEELARLLSGADLSKPSLQNARELLDSAGAFENERALR
ncbi:MAG: DNA repair protein RecN [Oligoflexales bacterium]|nr:DNA repair protein RecN [Oligoflexales bacterium]